MRIDGSSFLIANLGAALILRNEAKKTGDPAVGKAEQALRDFARDLARLRDTAGALDDAAATRSVASRTLRTVGVEIEVPGFANAKSSGSLGLSLADTATTRRSAQEVNAITTSYGPFAPVFSGASSASVTLNGTYDGSQGDNTLRVVARDTGVVGLGNLRFGVFNADGQELEEVRVSALSTSVTLGTGVSVSLGAGTVFAGAEFSFGVSSTVGSAVRADKAFNGTGNDRPNFEPGLSVGAGSFALNGVGITVAAHDSILSVLAKINASDAGVKATFDADTERIELAQLTTGFDQRIELGTDTSGFLAATKLAEATEQRGTDDERSRPIATVAALAGVQSGTFAVNGVSIAVDAATDSLTDVLQRITASPAGVDAGFDASSGKVELVARGAGSTLSLDDGTATFFTGVQVAPGSIAAPSQSVPGTEQRSGVGPREVRFRSPDRLQSEFEALGKQLQETFAETGDEALAAIGADSRERFGALLRRAFGVFDSKTLEFGGFGISVDLRPSSERLLTIDGQALAKAAVDRSGDLHEFLRRPDSGSGRRGFVTELDELLDGLLADVARRLDPGSGGRGLIDRSG